MGKKIIILLITLSFCSCKKSKDQNMPVTIKKIQIVKEYYDEKTNGYKLKYEKRKLERIEVEELKIILNKKKIQYYISNDNQIFVEEYFLRTIGSEFLISCELNDSLKKRTSKI